MANVKKENNSIKTNNWIAALGIVFFLIILSGIIILIIKASDFKSQAIQIGTSAASEAYQKEKEQAHDKAYNLFFEKAKDRYRTTVDVSISIESVRETADLNVLECYASDYFYHEDSEKKTFACIKVTGKGSFTINLNNAEYSVDNTQRIVYITLPSPVFQYLGETDMDDRGFYKDSIWNGSAKEGREIFDDLLKEASIKLSETLETDAALKYQDEAKTSAEKLMEGLVKAANPNVPDIEVVIDFR